MHMKCLATGFHVSQVLPVVIIGEMREISPVTCESVRKRQVPPPSNSRYLAPGLFVFASLTPSLGGRPNPEENL